jgi:hypothetical protein
LEKRVLVSERILDFLKFIIYAYRTTVPADACCCYDRCPFSVLFMHIHIVSKKRDDKVKRRKDAHGDKEKACNLSFSGLRNKDRKRYKGHEGISKRLVGGFQVRASVEVV